MPIRKNILLSTSTTVRDDYIAGVKLLKAEFSTGQPVSTYDRFVLWHVQAMSTLTPPGNSSGRNAAHMGPVFLPWHRMFLNRLEAELQRVLSNTDFGLPYWSWADDAASPLQSPLWNTSNMGPSGSGTSGEVTQGPFRASQWRVHVGYNSEGQLATNLDRGLLRFYGQNSSTLPTRTEVKTVLTVGRYDIAPWDRTVTNSFRNQLEGWRGPNLHNRVHVWVGGDMLQAFSPNDPIFFLHHANVDRIWAYWQTLHPNSYAPQSGPASLQRHRFNDAMFPLDNGDPVIRVRNAMTLPAGVTYDSFADLQ